MKRFWNWITGNKKLHFISNYEDEMFSRQEIKEHIKKLKDEKIGMFGLSSVNPNFLQSKEEELMLSRILLAHKGDSTPFYFRVTRHQIVEPKDFRLRLTFTVNREIKRYEYTGATTEFIESFWRYLITGKEISAYDFSKWHNSSKWYEGYLEQRKKQEEKELQHPRLLTDVFWDFSGNKFQDKNTFIQAVNDYHQELNKNWKPNENVNAPFELIVFYPYWKDDRQKTGRMTLRNHQPWTKADLLFAIHNKCVSKIQDENTPYMEGLTYHNHDNKNIATYFLNLGS